MHDVSWGTKGDNDAKALGGVTTTLVNGKDQVEVEMLTDIRDINTNYEKFIKSLSKPRPVEDKTPDDDTKMQDYFRSFRTRVVLTWLFSNAMVVIVMTNEELVKLIRQPFLISTLPNGDPPPGNPFLQFIFYSVLILSAIRFIGSTLYLIL